MRKILPLILIFCFVLSGCKAVMQNPLPPETSSYTSSPSPEPTPEPTPAATPRPLTDVNLVTSSIDGSYFEVPNEKGTLETVEYETKNYTSDLSSVTKQMCIYLPYGYDESKEYNVIFLMHTMGASERFWFSEHEYKKDDGTHQNLYIPYLIDNMIERGNCAPVIVVSLCGYINDDARYERNSDRDFTQFISEFKYDILPYMESNYAVAKGRDHVGFMGASFGAYLTYRSILGPCFDVCSYFGLTGGGTVEPGWLEDKWAGCNASDERANLIYIAEGDCDDRGPVELGYMYLAARNDLFDSDNLKFTLYENTAHEFREWDNTLFNCLQMFFREDDLS